ncbi:hypothetical protein [Streptomyces sp. NPDC059262]
MTSSHGARDHGGGLVLVGHVAADAKGLVGVALPVDGGFTTH